MDRATSIAHATTATAITIGGMVTGLHYEVLMAGFAGALASLSYLPAMTIWRRVWSLFTSSLTAGYTGPVFALYAAEATPGVDVTQAILVFSGFIMGLGAQITIPAVMSWLKTKVAAFQG